MEEEFKYLHDAFQQLGQLHNHLKQFKGQIPQQYSDDVKKVLQVWKFQKNLVKPQLPNHFYEPFMQMQTLVAGFWIDFYFQGVLQ